MAVIAVIGQTLRASPTPTGLNLPYSHRPSIRGYFRTPMDLRTDLPVWYSLVVQACIGRDRCTDVVGFIIKVWNITVVEQVPCRTPLQSSFNCAEL